MFYHYAASRGAEVAERLFEGFQGTLPSDGYAGYDAPGRRPGIVHVGCFAHARRKFHEALKAFDSPMLEKLSELIRQLVYDQVEGGGLARLTIDLDGTVLRTGAKVDGAERGFNPHHPKDPSCYPLTAHLAQLGQILRVWNRPGNVHDSHNAAGFLRGVFGDLRGRFGHRLPVELRMDAAFFHPEIFSFLDGERVEYALKVPM